MTLTHKLKLTELQLLFNQKKIQTIKKLVFMKLMVSAQLEKLRKKSKLKKMSVMHSVKLIKISGIAI